MRAVELLQAVLDRKLSAQDALNALVTREAKLSEISLPTHKMKLKLPRKMYG